jgi:hypothetical protein
VFASNAESGVMTAADTAVDIVFLADIPRQPASDEVRAKLKQLGLAPVMGADTAGPIRVEFAGTTLTLFTGPDAHDQYHDLQAAEKLQAIGGVTVADPDPDQSGLLALRVEGAPGDRRQRLQQVQHQCVVAAMIGEVFAAQRLYWPPAALWSPMGALVDAITALESEGLPPILHLVAFTSSADAVRTRGLAHFCGIELQLQTPRDFPATEAVRRLARLAVHAMIVGPLEPGAAIAGLARGEQLIIGMALDGIRPPVVPVHLQRKR